MNMFLKIPPLAFLIFIAFTCRALEKEDCDAQNLSYHADAHACCPAGTVFSKPTSALGACCPVGNTYDASIKSCCPTETFNTDTKTCCPVGTTYTNPSGEGGRGGCCAPGLFYDSATRQCCPKIAFNSDTKICCPEGQVYNNPTGIAGQGMCCPQGQLYDFAQRKCCPLNMFSLASKQCCPSGFFQAPVAKTTILPANTPITAAQICCPPNHVAAHAVPYKDRLFECCPARQFDPRTARCRVATIVPPA